MRELGYEYIAGFLFPFPSFFFLSVSILGVGKIQVFTLMHKKNTPQPLRPDSALSRGLRTNVN